MKYNEIEFLMEDFSLGDSDKKVILNFLDRKDGLSKKLSSDGKTLNGNWMGGHDVAFWGSDDKVFLNPNTGGKSADVIHRFIRKNAPKNMIKEDVDMTSILNPQVTEDHITDEDVAMHLLVYINNDKPTYDEKIKIWSKLKKFEEDGKYDSSKAPDIFRFLIDRASRKFNKDMTSDGYSITNKAKEIASKELADEFEQEYGFGNFKESVKESDKKLNLVKLKKEKEFVAGWKDAKDKNSFGHRTKDLSSKGSAYYRAGWNLAREEDIFDKMDDEEKEIIQKLIGTDLTEENIPGLGYIQAKKQLNGKYKLFYKGTMNHPDPMGKEKFDGEYDSASRAKDHWVTAWHMTHAVKEGVENITEDSRKSSKDKYGIYLETISSEIYEDSYTEGEGEYTGAGLRNEHINKHFNSMDDAIKYLSDYHGLSDDKNDYDIDNRTIATSQSVADHSHAQNGGWMTPTNTERELWKKGKMKLYVEHFNIKYHRVMNEGADSTESDDIGPSLSKESRSRYKKMLTPGKGVPVRFMYKGRALNISTGELDPKGINVIYQTVYWDFPKEVSLEIAKELGVKAVF